MSDETQIVTVYEYALLIQGRRGERRKRELKREREGIYF